MALGMTFNESSSLSLCGSTTKYLHIQSTTVYVPSLELGLPPTPLPQASVPSPPDQRVGGTPACT